MIEINVPIPNAKKYRFADLQPGESVLHLCAKKDKRNARKAAYRVGEYHKWKIVVRSLHILLQN